jgi:hypothetical protein
MEPPPDEMCPKGFTSWTGSWTSRTEGGVTVKEFTYNFVLPGGKSSTVKRTERGESARQPPESAPSEADLSAALAQCPTPSNATALQFAFAAYGKKVGDGQCYALGSQARASSARSPEGPLGLGVEVKLEEALPGDILQFSWAKFSHTEASGAWRKYYAGDQDSQGKHTAIVFSVLRRSPLKVVALEQNINGALYVTHRTYDFSDLTEGGCVVYRGGQ